MENKKLIGKKVKGFRFDGAKYRCGYSSLMDNNIGIIGTIREYEKSTNVYVVNFEKDNWNYPAELIEQHLVEEPPFDEKAYLEKSNKQSLNDAVLDGIKELVNEPKEQNPIDPLGILEKVFGGENVNEKDVIADSYIEALKAFGNNDLKFKPMCLGVDEIKTPIHYDNSKGYDVIDIANDYKLNFNRGSALKYICRAGKKDNEIQDLKKAIDFIQREIQYLEKN